MWSKAFYGVLAVSLLLVSRGPIAGSAATDEGRAPHMGEAVALRKGGVTLRVPGDAGGLRASAPVPASVTEGFEGAWPGPGWYLHDNSDDDGGEFLLGARACHTHTGELAGWMVGGGEDGLGLTCQGSYPAWAATWAEYGPFSLESATAVTLTFHLYGDSEPCDEGTEGCPYDFFFVGSSTDGENYDGVSYWGDWTVGDDGNGFSQGHLDLSGHLGEPRVWFGLAFYSDATISANGFTIDDITLEVDASTAVSETMYLPVVWRPPAP